MNLADTEENSTSEAVVSNNTNTHLSGSWLIIARTVWLVLVVPSLGLFIASLFVSYQQLQSGAIPALMQQMLSSIGLSVSGFATLNTILNVIISSIWYGVGFLIFWRRSDDWLALLAAFFLVMFNVTTYSNNNVPSTLAPRLSRPRFASQSHELSWVCLAWVVLSALPQWTACPALDGTDPAALHHGILASSLHLHQLSMQIGQGGSNCWRTCHHLEPSSIHKSTATDACLRLFNANRPSG